MTEQTRVDLEQLLTAIRKQFYARTPLEKFLKDQRHLQEVATWPATWLRARGITWTSERYFRTLQGLLVEIAKHGATGEIKYFPSYLLKVFQDHFAHNGDSYCAESKSVRNAVDLALAKVRFADAPLPAAGDNVIDVLAAAHAVLATRRRAPKTQECSQQFELL
jgi:hypothetical protein